MKLQRNYWLQTFLAVATKRKSEMTSHLNSGYYVMNYFAKSEKFLPHSIIGTSFMTVGSQMLEFDRGASPPPPPYKIGSQNTSYKLGLKYRLYLLHLWFNHHQTWHDSTLAQNLSKTLKNFDDIITITCG